MDKGWDRTKYLKDPRIPCKYGSKCYQKNEAHHEKYRHPPKRQKHFERSPAKRPKLFDIKGDFDQKEVKETKNDNCNNTSSSHLSDDSDNSSDAETSMGSSKKLEDISPSNKDSEETKTTEELSETVTPTKEKGQTSDVKAFINEKFLVEMPKDFYQFWNFCKLLNEKNPCNALKDVGLTLVGPYDVLAGKFLDIKQKPSEEYLLHWRYYRDPPEFQTVLKGNDNTGYHIGYFRDSPDEMPVFLACNKAKESGVFKTMGSNIFAAVNFYLEELKKTGDPFKKMHIGRIQSALKKNAQELNLELTEKTDKMIARDKKIVTRSFNKIGLVVPYDRKSQLGYRELALSNKEIKTLFDKLEKALPEQKPRILSELQPMFTFASIAADECDFGTGIELGLDIIAHGVEGLDDTAMRFLASNYRLINREAFAKIAEAHMKNRRKGCELSIL